MDMNYTNERNAWSVLAVNYDEHEINTRDDETKGGSTSEWENNGEAPFKTTRCN